MDTALQVLLGLTALICFAGGLNLLIKGAGAFLPADVTAPRALDNLFRFLSGMYFGMSFLLGWVVLHIAQNFSLNYFLGVVIITAGAGRLCSRLRVGSAGRYFDFIMIFEILLGLAVIIVQYLRVTS